MPTERNSRRDSRRKDEMPKRMIPTAIPAVLLPWVEKRKCFYYIKLMFVQKHAARVLQSYMQTY